MTSICGDRVELGDLPFVFNVDADCPCPGQRWVIPTPIDGWDSTGVRRSSSPRILEAGVETTDSQADARGMTLVGAVQYQPPETEEDVREQLQAAFDLIESPGDLIVFESVTKVLSVRRNGLARIRPITPRVVEFSVPLVADDPLKLSTTVVDTVVVTTGAVPVGGTHPAFPTIVVSPAAPIVPPWSIENSADPGRSMGWVTTTIGIGDTLIIDMASMTVTLNGVDAFSNLQQGYRRWRLFPGLVNTITASIPMTYTIRHQDAYL